MLCLCLHIYSIIGSMLYILISIFLCIFICISARPCSNLVDCSCVWISRDYFGFISSRPKGRRKKTHFFKYPSSSPPPEYCDKNIMSFGLFSLRFSLGEKHQLFSLRRLRTSDRFLPFVSKNQRFFHRVI